MNRVVDLKSQLASLQIERETPARSWWRRLRTYGAMAAVVAVALGSYFAIQDRLDPVDVSVVRPTLEIDSSNAGTPVVTASGYLVARRQAVVSAKVQGRLAALRVEEGSRVREGDVLARLESADYKAQVDLASAQLQHAEADLAEQQRQHRLTQGLAQARVVSQDQLDAAASRVRLAEAVLAQSRATLQLSQANEQNTIIRAPFSGVVLKKMAEVGESVAPIPPGVNLSTSSGAIVALADMNSLEAEADVGESSITQLHPGQSAEVSVQAFPERKYQGVLRQIIPTADRAKATITVRVSMLNKGTDLRPEMSARITFLESAKSGGSSVHKPLIKVPKEAVAMRDGKLVVLEVRSDQRTYSLPVNTAGMEQDQVVVTDGLSGSEDLVLDPPETLKQGDRVRIKR